ncbi:MAG: DNA polymerase III subunit beta [Clostridia bacterium]
MKFTCDSNQLSKACMNVQRTVANKTTIPALEGILFSCQDNKLLLTGYDLEVGSEIYLDADVQTQGSIILNAKHICDILRMLPDDDVSLSTDDRNICKIVCGETEYSLIGIPSHEYPDLPVITSGLPITISQELLNDMIKKTIFSVSVGEKNPVHNGVKFEIEDGKIVLIAVDGARLAIRRELIDYQGEKLDFVVPAKALNEITKLSEQEDLNYTINVGKRHITFEIDGYKIISRLLEGEFLNYKTALPTSYTTTVVAQTKRVIECVERTSLIITDKQSPVRCIIDENMMKFSSVTAIGTANDKMEAEVQGKKVEIGFNKRFVLEALKACDESEINLGFNSSSQPIIITPLEGEDFFFLVLPVRI